MSVRVMSHVWDSDLPPDEKFLALALADWASDDGARVFASQPHMAWKLGKTDRAVRDTLSKLQKRGVLVRVGKHYRPSTGGRGATVEYRIDTSALPTREPWETPFLHPEETSYWESRPEVYDAPPGSLRQPTRKPTSDDPLDDPLEEPLDQKKQMSKQFGGFAYGTTLDVLRDRTRNNPGPRRAGP